VAQATATVQTNSFAKAAGLLRCWCGSDQWRICFRAPRGGLARCEGCGCYQTDPPPLRQSEQSEEFYTCYYSRLKMDTLPVRNPCQSRVAGFWRVADQFPALREVAMRAVDIGSGDGHLCAELKGDGWPEAIGVEPSGTRVSRARALYPDITFYDGTLATSALRRDSFDLVVMESVIEHLPEPLTQLHEVKRIMRTSGRLVITTPNMDSGHFRLLGRRWTGMLAPHAHIFLFTASSLRTALERAGFRVEAVGSFDLERYTLRRLISRLLSGDVKGALWRAHQELGAAYGHVVSQQAMLYAIGRAQ